jgi:hypothetical protein
VPQDQEIKYTKLGAKYQEVLRMEREIWKRFIAEVLPELAPRTKWYKIFPELKVGDVVLVIEEGIPRGQWKIAVVEETKKSVDQIVRSAKIRMNGKLFDRPIINLFPLFDQMGYPSVINEENSSTSEGEGPARKQSRLECPRAGVDDHRPGVELSRPNASEPTDVVPAVPHGDSPDDDSTR